MRNGRYAWYVVGVLTLASISANIDRQILALLVVPIRRDLGLTFTETSYLIGLPFAVFYSLMGLPIARLADSGNRRNIIAVGIALWSVMTALSGLANTFWRLLLARIGVGVGEGALAAPAASLIADYFPRERLGGAMSVYSLAIFLGAGLAYFIGGSIVGIVSLQDSWTWPVIGTIRPWQTVFMFVGLPGLVVAALMLTVREPPRTGPARSRVPFSTLFAYLRANLRTFTCVSFGFTLSATVNWGIAIWLATFLMQTHDWTIARAGMVQGMLTMSVGVVGVLAGGRLADVFVRRGYIDGALRVGIVGATGMLVSASLYPVMPTATLTVVALVVVNFFAAFPWGAAQAAATDMVPGSMRAQGFAIYFFVQSLVSYALGPWAVAAITDYVFRDDAALGSSLAVVNVLGMTGAIALFVAAMPAFRRTLEQRDQWVQAGPVARAE